jgi:hypothetical protein
MYEDEKLLMFMALEIFSEFFDKSYGSLGRKA